LEQAMLSTSAGKVGHAARVIYLGEADLLANRVDEAIPLARQALTSSRACQEPGNLAYALRLLGEIDSQRGPPDVEGAERHYRQALALAEDLGMRPL
jgi:tetratricopeptide (TPR) repeat protein